MHNPSRAAAYKGLVVLVARAKFEQELMETADWIVVGPQDLNSKHAFKQIFQLMFGPHVAARIKKSHKRPERPGWPSVLEKYVLWSDIRAYSFE